MSLQGKKILIGISGSIAAYKIIYLVRLLVKQEAEVKVVMTPAAASFVSPLVLSTLSKNPVLVDLSNDHSWANHVALGRWADVMLIAPLSCNTLSKMAHGACDNLLLAVYLSATCPVMVAPAMDEDMWKHPATQQNLSQLKSFGHHIISVEKGELASGLFGEGRMAEPETIAEELRIFLNKSGKEKDFSGQKVLITAGPTYEKMDPVRFIGNFSSGKMGIAIAEEFAQRGADVVLVLGPTSLKPGGVVGKTISVQSAEEMYKACIQEFQDCDIAVMAAAVADYTPAVKENEKIKKQGEGMILELTKTKDILASLGAVKNKKQILVGFALETNKEREYALQKLNSKNADMIVMNSLQTTGAGFGTDTNEVTLFFKNGAEQKGSLKSKTAVAADIVNAVKTLQHD
ncbi:bifunctional phosphopantothenoylcysteine decarboxylase/phosphopantothenate--cysteine ligase CoaBC [Lacibacter sp. MH-610]|uniref:bifunctional phosphopantothenoylcysteine decarboxylase/phosphopantothenate--cysteine ligase CoaBC n=1 Tax=Lacibacter sp. MH-610 TaxID=3020883 RepID=UPI00389202E7